MRRGVRRAATMLGVVAGLLFVPGVAVAHPLGNFTVNTSAGIVVSPDGVRVDYVVDMAEIPTVQVRSDLDADRDDVVTEAERSSWAAAKAAELLVGLTLTVDGRPVGLAISSTRAELLPGQGGLDVLRLEASFAGSVAAQGRIAFADDNFAERIGWREVTAAGIDGVALEDATVPATSPSDRLRRYPEDLLSSPLDIREAELSFAPGTSAPAPGFDMGASDTGASGAARPGVAGGAFAGLLGRTGPLMVLALGLAFGFGALHALGPGHGKTLMAGYLVGAGGRTRQAVAVGGAVAVMHTASVLGLGFVVLSATEVIAPERVYPWLGLGSGLIALALGATLLISRIGSWSEHRGHEDHDHHHAHDHQAARHVHPRPETAVLSRRGLLALAVAGGILPSPTALVVLLASVALHRIGYGLALIGAFSLGLASALVAVGALALRTRDVVARRLSGRSGRLVPVASAISIVLLGLVLTVNGLTQV